MQANQERPAYVRFEIRQIENRSASDKAGHYVGTDVVFALITPQGSKDQVERIAEDWIEQNFTHAREGRLPMEWARAYKESFEAFKDGREMPENGTPILTWPPLSPSQQKAVLDANIRTVEDLAIANEGALNLIGIGGRSLKQKAQAWLDASGDTGKTAAELETLRQLVADLTGRVETAEEVNRELAAKLAAQKEDA